MSMKVNKNGKEYPIGVIPKNYPASNIKMANGESVEDVVDELYQPTKIAEASANQTYSAQLTDLQTAFNALSPSQKLRSFIKYHNGYIARYTHTEYDLHNNFEVSSNLFVAVQISITNSVFRTYDGNTIRNLSSELDASPIELWV